MINKKKKYQQAKLNALKNTLRIPSNTFSFVSKFYLCTKLDCARFYSCFIDLFRGVLAFGVALWHCTIKSNTIAISDIFEGNTYFSSVVLNRLENYSLIGVQFISKSWVF